MSDDYVIRPVRVDDWPNVKALRLTSLKDPLAPIAFLGTFASAAAQPDQFWKDRTGDGAEGGRHRQFVAEAPDGEWLGTVTVLIEQPGSEDFTGRRAEQLQAHLVAVFVREQHRGGPVAGDLFRTALDWAWAQEGVSRVRLFVHKDNTRAEAFYRKTGFTRTRPTAEEYEMDHHRP